MRNMHTIITKDIEFIKKLYHIEKPSKYSEKKSVRNKNQMS